MSFLPARTQTYRNRQCVLLGFANPMASTWDIAHNRLSRHLVNLWIEGQGANPSRHTVTNYDALCKMHTESFSAWTWCHVLSFLAFFVLENGDKTRWGNCLQGVNEAQVKGWFSLLSLYGSDRLAFFWTVLKVSVLQWPSDSDTTLPSWFLKRTWNST